MEEALYLGLDAGSTTVKLALVDARGTLLEARYERHGAAVRATLRTLLEDLAERRPGLVVRPAMTGSAALRLAQALELPFVQEVLATSRAIAVLAPQTDVAVELGGEDAKILYFSDGSDNLRMNEACAGGTGAFIDQMASLLDTDAAGLDALAARHTTIYPIASRCGVFAKTDVVPLLNEGAPREDLAASIFQAVVEQTIGGLACGHPIRGKVAFLGGPLHFLPQLKARFVETLHMAPEDVVDVPDAQYVVARGTALSLVDIPGMGRPVASAPVSVAELAERARTRTFEGEISASLPPLFDSEDEYHAFLDRHRRDAAPRGRLDEASGPLYLGVDLGSTTVKAVLVDINGAVLDTWYQRNQGDPLAGLLPYAAGLVDRLPAGAWIQASAATGYGADYARAALGSVISEVETVAHLKAACRLVPDATYVIDIGGQDMKCLKVRQGCIAGVTLNEACSAGCGAFLETFAQSLNLSMEDFVQAALFARHPVDLGSRCTVFMNSKVKQAQKEGASIGDIAAGLCYAVIRNALYKVLRLRTPDELGERVLVQGGSFMNDALLRVMENLLQREVSRPDIAGLMGAYGAALLALRRCAGQEERTPLSSAGLRSLEITTRSVRCRGCGNHCLLKVHRFSNGHRFVSGNRCERGGMGHSQDDVPVMPNIYAWKARRLFRYRPLEPEQAPRGRMGIPRVLNIYEHYPFWFTFFTRLGYRVELSPASGKELYDLGLSSMPYQTVCYPAKLAHGHVTALLRQGVREIFFPCLPREGQDTSVRGYNCPVVSGYPEVIRLNTDEVRELGAHLYTPFVSLEHLDTLVDRLHEVLGLPKLELWEAAHAARAEQEAYRAELRAEGERILAQVERDKGLGIVLCGRPYHADPAVHHGLPDYIASLGAAVLSEDSVAHLGVLRDPLRVVDQWSYHSRLYRAAEFVRTRDDLELIQLNSFGCGLDAITADQLSEILEGSGKLYTLIKIDEVNSLGAARIRIRSLLAAMEQRRRRKRERQIVPAAYHRTEFTKKMFDEGYTILAPKMSPIHFDILQPAMHRYGYHVVMLENDGRSAIETGLRFVNNDACYPSIITVGQMMEAVLSGKYDTDRLALAMTQTGGCCRASNYVGFIRRALDKAGLSHIPVISFNANGMEKNGGLKISPSMLMAAVRALVYGDLLMRCLYRVRPYEKEKGSADALAAKWRDICVDSIVEKHPSRSYRQVCRELVQDFDALPIDETLVKPRVGVVGEILVKYMPVANNHLVELLEREGAEAVVPDLMDFFNYSFYGGFFKHRYLGLKWTSSAVARLVVSAIRVARGPAIDALSRSRRFEAPMPIEQIAALAEPFLAQGNQYGEGWFLAGEMAELLTTGVSNIVCIQPFACLPNHVVGKGVIKKLRAHYPDANIVAVDYDPGSSEANQLNRLKLMLAVAKKKAAQVHKPAEAAHSAAAQATPMSAEA